MEVTGICSICGRPGKLFTCPLCGRLVCSRCLTGEGICVQCARGRRYSASRT
ncbi:orotate phosphoribosyltransferase [Candidatus Methanoperedens nitratireducens]|uniref:orotate phosphoribosyltransferase n=1 Tax=Candidatus Methanoperedens nitratireducens TaxID=1392998 RepID=UPI000BB970D3|nr:orotate phosphoribosyltransferase [Candidatus Methanoperedens nitroreducens]